MSELYLMQRLTSRVTLAAAAAVWLCPAGVAPDGPLDYYAMSLMSFAEGGGCFNIYSCCKLAADIMGASNGTYGPGNGNEEGNREVGGHGEQPAEAACCGLLSASCVRVTERAGMSMCFDAVQGRQYRYDNASTGLSSTNSLIAKYTNFSGALRPRRAKLLVAMGMRVTAAWWREEVNSWWRYKAHFDVAMELYVSANLSWYLYADPADALDIHNENGRLLYPENSQTRPNLEIRQPSGHLNRLGCGPDAPIWKGMACCTTYRVELPPEMGVNESVELGLQVDVAQNPNATCVWTIEVVRVTMTSLAPLSGLHTAY